jgi:hypothetical protein
MIPTGETNVFPQDGAAINEMNRLEKEYTDLLQVKRLEKGRSLPCYPGKDRAGEDHIMVFGSFRPLALMQQEVRHLSELMPEAKTATRNNYHRKQQGPSTSKNDKLYYRVPDVANIKITFGNEIFKVSRRLIYQFGNVVQLPSNYIIGK